MSMTDAEQERLEAELEREKQKVENLNRTLLRMTAKADTLEAVIETMIRIQLQESA